MIAQVAANSPAEQAGLKAGDIILGYNGQNLKRTSDLINLINRSQINQKVSLTILRANKRQEMNVTLRSAPDETTATKTEHTNNPTTKLGIALRELTPQEQARHNLQGIVVENVSYTGLAAQSGVQQYDVITQIGQKTIKNLNEFRQVMASLDKKGVVPIYLVRQGQPMILGLRLQ